MLNIQMIRPAIAMIELIFAIVIMGIVLMSAPMLISTATKSGYVSIIQEAIHGASSQVNMMTGYHWDERSADELFLDPILRVSAGSSDLDSDVNSSRRKGTPKESYRSFIRSDGTDDLNASVVLGKDGTETSEDDIDDFTGITNLIEIATSVADNVEKTTINISRSTNYNTDTVTGGYNQSDITYIPFVNATGTTNIKGITVNLSSTSVVDDLNKSISLRAFSCNIGAYKLEERDF
ncbi:MAG: hypothetical protein COB07_01250 [Sulfurovum sp.]|nr:MAG: hypothetical protein COB07_01250 [Sulfurovum sp.]